MGVKKKVENKSLVLSALCNIVVRLENPNDCCTIVGGLASQTIADLRLLLQPSQDGDQMNALVENVECLCSIVKSADTENQPHPLTKVVADSWEVLILLFNKFCSTPGQESRATEVKNVFLFIFLYFFSQCAVCLVILFCR